MTVATRSFQPLRAALEFVGEISMLFGDSIRRLPTPPFEWQETLSEMAFVGVASLPIVMLTTFFSGAVVGLYVTEFLSRYGGSSFVGGTVGITVCRELGPVLAGITVAARCGSSMASRLATMAVTEQLDALKMLSVHPTKYLVIPRLVAAIAMMPILGLASICAGSFGGYVVALSRGLTPATFIDSYRQYVTVDEFTHGIMKTPIFGVIIILVACQQGLRARDGAVGVGRATTNTVVVSIVLVYLADFIIASLTY